jgi:uncharacterized protein
MGRPPEHSSEGRVMADPLAAWRTYIGSSSAPKAAMSPLELDGYLTGVIVCPQPRPIMPSTWLVGLWGEEEPVFDNDEQIKTVLGAVMEHYNALIAGIDRSLKRLEADGIADYRPLFLSGDGKPQPDAVRRWVHGFWKAMSLAPRPWRMLGEDERTQPLLTPFIGFIDVEDGEPFEPADNIDELLDEAAAAIPRAVTVLRKLAQIRSQPAEMPRWPKTGRNDPCPCGSGKKYKRCCGAA